MPGVMNLARWLGCVALLALLGGCASGPTSAPGQIATPPSGSGRDGTPGFRADLDNIPDAIPRPEVRTAAGNKSPYTVLGKTYRVRPVPPGYRERGLGSCMAPSSMGATPLSASLTTSTP